MVVRRGHVVAEGWWAPYAASRPHLAYPLSKTLTATATGFLGQDGRLGLDDPVLDLLPPEAGTSWRCCAPGCCARWACPVWVPWHPDPAGHAIGFSGAHLTTEVIAAVGQLYLDGGA